ncbi:prolyl oligopeptidase family serine peptidase [Streptomyces sp. WMMC905]|uniref:prolyl oligopeptidase family serine peptidase n=1 Tax=Streptomyces sp. WMMC905 TaxID=3404123 RepID=UPI003B9609AC
MPTLPYGTWPSPIDARTVAACDGRPDDVGFVGDDVWWTEPRPKEDGRRTLMRRRSDGAVEQMLPAPWDARSRVIEYGGRPWTGRAGTDGFLVVFAHRADQRLYALRPGGEPRPLTPVSAVGGGLRWAEPSLPDGRAEVWCVMEEFTGDGPGDVRRVLAAVPLDGSAAEDRDAVRELVPERHRFLSGPRLSLDGRRAAWLAWDHPRMPWDETELLVAEVDASGVLGEPERVAGGRSESVAQVEWAADGALLYTSDRTGWWNIHRDGAPVCPREEEFAGPLWRLGLRWSAPLDNGLAAVLHGRGALRLGILDVESGEVVDAAGPWTEFAPTLAVLGDRVAAVGASPHSGYEVVELDARTGHTRVVGHPHHDVVDPAYYPRPRVRTFVGAEGREVHATVYPPRHPDCVAPETECPPYVVRAHGGPTGRSTLALDLAIAALTSRGIGVVEVDYGGSSGYGREYRDRLRGEWGVVDVADCAAVALALAAEGSADRDRIAVSGGSAGGWTAAASLVGTDVYACGTIVYPVLDLVDWAAGGTHDFESHYLETLVGPHARVPERYAERSPAAHADRITAPFLLLQGLDDVICPPAQAERLLARATERGVPHTYLAFPGEGHGFRRAETIARAWEAELRLYEEVFGISALIRPHPGPVG